MAAIELREAMSTLRAVRRLRPDPIPDDVLRRVLQAATWAPTGGNRQAWRVIVVKDSVRNLDVHAIRYVFQLRERRIAIPRRLTAYGNGNSPYL